LKKYNFAVVGATGLVGRKFLQVMEERKLPIKNLRLFASARSAGMALNLGEFETVVEDLNNSDFSGIDIALFSAGGSRSKEFAPRFVQAGSLVIDNSSAFRMEPDVPLVVPEINPHRITKGKREIIANPNCSTIQLVLVLKPLLDNFGIERVVVSTYQAVSGSGKKGQNQLQAERNGEKVSEPFYPCQIDVNCLPAIGNLNPETGYFDEEEKVMKETRKILEDDTIKVTCTAVRVPVWTSHSESVNVQLKKEASPEEIREVLREMRGVVVMDDPGKHIYPLAVNAAEKDEVFVGRIRKDLSIDKGIDMWVVSDNLRKGAATNAVQIAQKWISLNGE